jgi:HPt (histidine-containing phosphotransfer) domain-containing protein
MVADLSTAIAAGDLASARRNAHTLKNSAENIAAHCAQELSFRIEQLLASGDLAGAAAHVAELRDAVATLAVALAEFADSILA